MKSLVDSVFVKAPCSAVFTQLVTYLSSGAAYRSWHKDHVDCNWIGGQPFYHRAILNVKEMLHGKQHNFRFVVTRYKPNSVIEYKFLFPASIICPKGAFYINPVRGGSEFTAVLFIRFASWFSLFGKQRIKDIKQHMHEENQNLKSVVEQNPGFVAIKM